MIDVLLPVVLLVGVPVVLLLVVVILFVAIGALRSSRRAENLGENRYELMREQHDRLEALREERLMLMGELEREAQERRRFMESLAGARPRPPGGSQEERRVHIDDERKADQQERAMLRSEKDLQHLVQELEQERQGHSEARQRIDLLEQELARSEEELGNQRQQADRPGTSLPWWRRPVLVIVLLIGVLAVWFASLMVALKLR